MRSSFRVLSVCVAVSLGPISAARAQAFADVQKRLVDYAKAEDNPVKACEAMGQYKAKDIVSIQSVAVPASGAVPAYCKVTGVLAPEIAFEVALPAKWNGRFYMIGNGGHAGESMEDNGRAAQRNEALRNGFSFGQTNTGHDSRKEPGASFVMSNPQKAIDYAFRAVHVTATTAKDITKDYYGTPARRSYWNSCSNGGRQGLIEAQRFPDDFDGVIANAPWADQTGFTVGALWNQRALNETPLSPAKLALVAGKVMDKCDAVDGLKDGLIDDPRQCRFDPLRDVPACSAGADGDSCLTPAQAATFAKIYSGPTTGGRALPVGGFLPGSEAMNTLPGGGSGSGWLNVIVNTKPEGRAADFNLADNTVRYLWQVPPKPEYDTKTFDFDRDLGMMDAWGRLADAKDADLSAFRARGGKLLMTYGWADAVLQPMMGVNYYQNATAVNGPSTPDFFRLFMIPGMAHCSGGVGPDRHDPVTAIINWVEKGQAPDTIIASKVVDGKVTRTRPLCAYPQVARYKGTGSIDDAANFSCVKP